MAAKTADSLAGLRLERLRRLRELQQEIKRVRDLEDGLIKRPWREIARPEQLAPPGTWFVWCILAGRGWGKSRTAAEWAAQKARDYPGARIALVGKTFADTRDTMLEGESGLIACFNRDEFRNHSEDDGYNRTLGEVRLANGSGFKSFSAEKPWRLRGPQFHFAWADEAAFWQDAHKGLVADTTWSNLVITLRLPKKTGWDEDYRTQVVIATTPRPVALLRTSDPDPSRMGILQRTTTMITRGRTMDNIENLTKEYQENVIAPLLGTRLGRQELEAEILDDVPGALWQRDWFEETRVTDPALVPDLIRVVVGVDPAVTDGEASAQTGVIVAGAAKNGRGYVLGDFTLRATPMEAMKRVIAVYHEFKADRVVAEVNNGGDFIGTLLKTVDPNIPFQAVRATRGKAIRAEPISSLYEQRRISHVGTFPYLEDQMCLIAGTAITTMRGEIPIEQVTCRDLVMTRAGWRPVTHSGFTGIRRTVTITAKNGDTITCTPDHPVFSPGSGFVPAGALVPGAKITRCMKAGSPVAAENQRSHSSSATVSGITSGTARTGSHHGHGALNFSIATSGKNITVPYPTGITCTTSITTPTIMTSAISCYCHAMITSLTINLSESLVCTHTGETSRSRRALMHGNGVSSEKSRSSVLSVIKSSSQQEFAQRFAHVSVAESTVHSVQVNAVPSAVYNITVTGQHEYFANGILVHNCAWTPMDGESPDRIDACVWAISALKDLIGGSFLAAYGVTRCESCQHPFVSIDPATKQPRLTCPKCGSPVVLET
jgi:phage terminase large subunit-like protein